MRLAVVLQVLALSVMFSSGATPGQEPAERGDVSQSTPAAQGTSQPERFTRFSQALADVVFSGHFTMDDSSNARQEERYEIHRVTKLDKGDYWLFHVRIKYGSYDVTLPLPLEVKWAGQTPVIILDQVTIPGLGTFDARVIIDGKRYAGTWTHGGAGGHLFGKIEKKEP